MPRNQTPRAPALPVCALFAAGVAILLSPIEVAAAELHLWSPCVAGSGLGKAVPCGRFGSVPFAQPRERVELELAAADPGVSRSGPDTFEPETSEPDTFEPDTFEPADPPAPLPRRRLFDAKTIGLTAGVLIETPVVGYLSWWKGVERRSLHAMSEGWFGRDTYSGGADKASHVVCAYIVSRELIRAFERFGHPGTEARALAVGLTTMAGLVIETGDGLTIYGFSWEDAASDLAGALAASEISRRGWDDLFGMRIGRVHAPRPGPDHRTTGLGSDYSRDIHFADLKLAGAFRRLAVRPGPARYLLLSLTYGTKGYRFSPVERRERNIGIDLGLNLPEILKAVGVRETSWWGRPLLTFFSYYRLAYTSVGVRYDLNHRRWNGPDAGDQFDPGAVFYP